MTPEQNDEHMRKPEAASAGPSQEPAAVREGKQRPQDPKDADDVMDTRLPQAKPGDEAVLAESRRHTRRSFLVSGAGVAAVGGFYAYLNLEPQAEMQPGLLRNVFNLSADASRELFREHALAPTYPVGKAEMLRVNGTYGVMKAMVPASWRLQMVGVKGQAMSPRYVEDVTAWEYKYTEAVDHEDTGHDNKTDPSKQAPPPGAAPPAGSADGKGAPQKPAGTEGKGEASDTATKMAPAKMQGQAHADQARQAGDTGNSGSDPMKQGAKPGAAASGGDQAKKDDDDDDQTEDDDHLGRKPRGQGEAGESDSTLRAGTAGLLLTMDDFACFPRHELVTQFKCIEGWSQIVHWAGFRMSDFLDAYPPELVDGKEPRYVYMETPDGDYYVGYDLHVLRHPQTLLVTEMMGQPLTQLHGAPLRLHTPLKYGYKQIKRIGLIAYTNEKPDDYWTRLGYDWYAGL